MFKDDYRKAMSFPVSEELRRRTAQQMKKQQQNPRISRRRHTVPKLIATAAAVCLLATEMIGFAGLSKNGGYPNASDTAGIMKSAEDADVSLADEYTVDISPRSADGGGWIAEDEAGTAEKEALLGGALPEEAFIYGAPTPTESDMYSKGVPESTDLPLMEVSLGYSQKNDNIAYSAEELVYSNQPTTTAVKALPVYQNLAVREESGIYSGEGVLSKTEMQAYAEQLVTDLGQSPAQLKATVAPNSADSSQTLSCSLGNVAVYANGIAEIRFDADSVKLSSIPSKGSTLTERVENAAASFYKQYQKLFSIGNAVFSTNTNYDSQGRELPGSIIYDQSGSYAEQLYSYNLNHVDINITEAENKTYALTNVSFRVSQAVKLVGEYPVITEEEARQELLAGNYVSEETVDAVVTAAAVKSVELTYPTNDQQEYYRPYYRFLVETEAQDASSTVQKGLYTYAALYVPAVEASYLVPASK